MKFTASVLFFSQSYLRLFTLLILYSTHLNYYFVTIFNPYSSYFRLVEAFQVERYRNNLLWTFFLNHSLSSLLMC